MTKPKKFFIAEGINKYLKKLTSNSSLLLSYADQIGLHNYAILYFNETEDVLIIQKYQYVVRKQRLGLLAHSERENGTYVQVRRYQRLSNRKYVGMPFRHTIECK